jgi:hypothetical protein
MYQERYYIANISGFYQETLEAYGFAKLLDMILNNDENIMSEIKIINQKNHYEIIIDNFDKITFEQKVNAFCTNPNLGFDYIFKQTDPKKGGTAKPLNIQTQKELDVSIFDISKEWEVIKNYNASDKSENSKAPHPYFNIYELFSNFSIEYIGSPHLGGTKQAGMFTRTFLQLYYNKEYFKNFLNGLFFLFSSQENQLDKDKYAQFVDLSFPKNQNSKEIEYNVLGKNHKVSKTTYNQLLNPNASKGLNSEKMRLSELSGEPEILREYLKILGSFNSMFSVGGNKTLDDYRVYVSVPNDIDFIQQKQIFRKFKKIFYTNSTYKADIYASLLFTKTLIEHLEFEKENIFDFDYTPTNYIEGFFMCHFMTMKKSPPKKHAPINLAFIALPKFIKAGNKEEADEWVETLDNLYKIIRSIRGSEKTEETGEIIRGLGFFRDFVSTSNLESFLSFSFWYTAFLVKKLDEKSKEKNKQIYVSPFKTSSLNKIYSNMASNLSEIIENEGFKAVAAAIRKSTVSLLRTPKSLRKFEPRYGLAQQLQNKSKSKDEFTTFIAEFLTTYDAETSNKIDKLIKDGLKPKDAAMSLGRANIKANLQDDFFTLLEKYSDNTRLIGALLASYGFALERNEAKLTERLEKLQEEATNLGYQLVKIEDEPTNLDLDSLNNEGSLESE